MIAHCPSEAFGDTNTKTPFKCPVDALKEWTIQEKWVWQKACEGSEADLAQQYGGATIAVDTQNWPLQRILRPGFLRTVLLKEPFRSAIDPKGLRIRGAWFKEQIDFDGAQIKSELWIDESLLERGANLINASLKRITFDGTTSKEPLIFQGCQVEQDVSMQSGSSFSMIDLERAKIGGSLFLQETSISGKLAMDSLRVDGDLFIRSNVKLGEVDLRVAVIGRIFELSDAKVAGTINLNGAQLDGLLIREKVEAGDLLLNSIMARRQIEILNVKSTGTLDLSDARVDGNLFIRDKSEFANIAVVGARIANQLDIANVKTSGMLDLNNVRVDGDLYIQGGSEFATVSLVGARIGHQLSIINTNSSGTLDLGDVRVEGGLFIRGDSEFAAISLVGARIGHQLEITNINSSGALDLNTVRVEGSLFIRQNSKFSTIILRGAKVGRQLELIDVTVSRELDMASIEVGTNLFLRVSASSNVTLKGATIGKDADARGSKLLGHVEMDGLDVRGDLQLSDTTLDAISLRGTRIAGELRMGGSTVNGPITAEALSVGTTLALNENAKFKDISMVTVKVGGIVTFANANFAGDVSIENLQSSTNVLLRDSTFDRELSIILSKVDGSMTLENAHISSLNLSATSIGGELSLERMQWQRNGQIKLRNTSVGTVADDKDAWPSDLRVSLGGFVYQRWGGLNEEAVSPDDKPAKHPVGWYSRVVERNNVYSKQPYEQLAGVLKVSGYADAADDILFAEKQRELFDPQTSIPEKLQKFLLMIFIGFGHRVYYAIPWTLFFVVLGAFVVTRTKEGRDANLRYGLAYSLDVLIPLIKLREAHYKIDFVGGRRPARYYFYLHKIMGFVLASFLIAGLSGLTK
jgi:uncharacterized protein YjbI with pentapeptide repeats